MNKQIINLKYFVLITATLLILVIHYPFYKSLPPNYGWWQTYALLSNDGYHLYSDLNLKFTPLYIYYYKIVLLFSDEIYFSITLGIIRTLLIFLFSFYIYFKISENYSISFISACILFYSIVEPSSYLPDDYHTFWKLFVILYLFFTVKLIEAINKNANIIFTIYGLFLSSIFLYLCKQNVGLLAFICTIFIQLHLIYFKHINVISFLKTLSVSTFLILILFHIFNISLSEAYNLTFNNHSKGPVSGIAFNLFRKENFNYIYTGLIITFLFYILKKFDIQFFLKNKLHYLNFSIINIFIVLIVLVFTIRDNYSLILHTTFLFIIISFIKLFIHKDITGIFFYIILSMAYASSLASNIASQDLVFFLIPFLLYLIKNKFYIDNKFEFIISIIFILMISMKLIELKFNIPYHWWQQVQSPIYESTNTPKLDKFNHISVDDDTYEMLNTAKVFTEKYSKFSNDVLYYPHIPIYYYLFNKIPFDNQLVYWFDFSESNDIDRLIQSTQLKQPKLIVNYDPSYLNYISHSSMKREKVAQFKFNEFLNQSVINGSYKLLYYKSFPMNNLKRIKYENMELQLKCINDDKIYSFNNTPEYIDKFILSCGGIEKEYEKWYSLKIYVKND